MNPPALDVSSNQPDTISKRSAINDYMHVLTSIFTNCIHE
jgi:hypothetical protein